MLKQPVKQSLKSINNYFNVDADLERKNRPVGKWKAKNPKKRPSSNTGSGEKINEPLNIDPSKVEGLDEFSQNLLSQQTGQKTKLELAPGRISRHPKIIRYHSVTK